MYTLLIYFMIENYHENELHAFISLQCGLYINLIPSH